MNHKPTPWKWEWTEESEQFCMIIAEPNDDIVLHPEILVNCTTEYAGSMTAAVCIDRGDAEFILKAVNSHDALVDLAERLLAYMTHGDLAGCTGVQAGELRIKARTALKLAEDRTCE